MSQTSEQFREILIKRLTLKNTEMSTLIDQAFSNYKGHLKIKGRDEVNANPQWYRTLSVDSVMRGWLKEKTADLKNNVHYADVLVDPKIQKIIRENRNTVMAGMEGIIRDIRLGMDASQPEVQVTEYEQLGPAVENLSKSLVTAMQQVVDTLGKLGETIRQSDASKKSDTNVAVAPNKTQDTSEKIK